MVKIIFNKKSASIIAVFIFVVILFISFKLYDRLDNNRTDNSEEISTFSETEEKIEVSEESKPAVVYVDIKGAIVKPRVYKLGDEKRVLDAIQLAGGLQNDADQTKINLAAHVTDEMVIYVPVIGESLLDDTGVVTSRLDDGKININTAASGELESLPGIGAAKAASIITFRETNGPFKEIEDLINVSGIGGKSFEKLKDKIKVR